MTGVEAAGAGGRGAIGNKRLVEARANALLIVPVRGALALGGVAGARALGVSPGAALGLFAFGTGIVLFPLLTSRRRRLFWAAVAEAAPLEGEASVEGRLRTTVRAAYPSTIGLTVLTAIALAADPELAAFLAGTLAALGLGAAIHGVEVVLWERSRGRRLLLGPDDVYVR